METDEAPSSSIFHTGWRRTRASSLLPKMLTWPTRLRFFRRRTVWLPTWVSWFLIAAISLILAAAWFTYGESLLARNHRVPADVLVAEGWIGREGVHAAVTEFEHGSYRARSTPRKLTHWSLIKQSLPVVALGNALDCRL